MKTCSNCILTENSPGIHFDERGTCSHCTTAKTTQATADKEATLARFREIIAGCRGKYDYDCLIAYSGGKDSTYTLYLMRELYDLKILAFSFDNWFQSEHTHSNIRKIVKGMDIDLITVTPSYHLFRDATRASLLEEIHPRRALERTSSVCATCISFVRYTGYRIAIEKQIPLLMLGMSPGQAPLRTAIFKPRPGMLISMQNAVLTPLKKHITGDLAPYFLEDRHLSDSEKIPFSINPLAFHDYDEEHVMKIAKGLGWEKPDDTDANSTNCRLNMIANEMHRDRYGYNPYSFELAEMVRQGIMTRDEAIRRLNEPPPADILAELKKEILGST